MAVVVGHTLPASTLSPLPGVASLKLGRCRIPDEAHDHSILLEEQHWVEVGAITTGGEVHRVSCNRYSVAFAHAVAGGDENFVYESHGRAKFGVVLDRDKEISTHLARKGHRAAIGCSNHLAWRRVVFELSLIHI